MDWQQFIKRLLRDFRTTPYRLAKEHGVGEVKIFRVLKGETKKPSQLTIKQLEEALGIAIDDNDPTNVSYRLRADVTPSDSVAAVSEERARAQQLIDKLIAMIQETRNEDLTAEEYEDFSRVVSSMLKLLRRKK